MKTETVSCYNATITTGVNNEYPTPLTSFKQPCLHLICAVRNSGKSYLCSKILAQAKRDKTFDKIYIVTPSFCSNKAYFGKYIDEEDVFSPTKSSINEVIARVEADRDEWEEFLEEKKRYAEFSKDIKNRPLKSFDPEELIYYLDMGYLDKPPKWKYEKEEPVKSCIILDDCLGSEAILQSSGLTRVATLNRHIAPLKEEHSGRSACGLAVIILSQSYRLQNGISRCLRENLSILTLFKNKQEKQLNAIKEELANVVDTKLFDIAYKHATKEKYGNLTIDFSPRRPEFRFRKNLNELIILEEEE